MGAPDPDWLLERMSPKLFDEWMAYSNLEPFGEPWRQTAEICAMSLNAQGGKKGGQPFTAEEMHFMPQPVLSEEELAEKEAAQWRSYARNLQRELSQEGLVIRET